MFIQPINTINSIEQLTKTSQNLTTGASAAIPFQSVLQDALNNVQSSNEAVDQAVYNLTTGQTDDLHEITIASTKATLATELFVQLRNKALDSYNEIMRMGV